MLHTKIKGRIEQSEFHDGNYYTTIISPAPDAYSKPSAFRGRSAAQLGAIGQEVEVDVNITGTVYLEKWLDRQTNQQRQMYKPTVYMEFMPLKFQQPLIK